MGPGPIEGPFTLVVLYLGVLVVLMVGVALHTAYRWWKERGK